MAAVFSQIRLKGGVEFVGEGAEAVIAGVEFVGPVGGGRSGNRA